MIEEMSAERFHPRDWDIRCWDSLDLSWGEMFDGESYIGYRDLPHNKGKKHQGDMLLRALDKYAIGYCDSTRMNIRPREGWVAIMCERDGGRFWFHIQKNTLNALLEHQKRTERGEQ